MKRQLEVMHIGSKGGKLMNKKWDFALHPAHFARALQPFQIYPCAS